MLQNAVIKLVLSFYENYNLQNFEAMNELFNEEVIYTINDYPPSVGIKSFIEHMQHSVHNYREQLLDIIPMANHEGSFASARFRFCGHYFGDGVELGVRLEHRGHAYDLLGYNFFVISNGKIKEIKAFFSECDLKRQLLAAEKNLERPSFASDCSSALNIL